MTIRHALHQAAHWFRIVCLLVAAGLLPAPAAHAQQEAQAMLLIAAPQLRDPYFAESVVLVTRHGNSRPMGVILNRPTPVHVGSREEFEDEKHPGRPLYFGGPVGARSLIHLFRTAAALDGRPELLHLGDRLYLAIGEAPGAATELKSFIGLAAWDNDQLEAEIQRGDWRVLALDPAQVFRQDTATLWQELLAQATRQAI
ncbi:MAG TPA: YqgE/AlgH family protein [Rhodocyclaceae bacterium]